MSRGPVAVPAPAHAISPLGLANLAVVYLGWSSTYLAIRIAVREGAGFPPFMLGGARVLAAGLILLTVAAIAGSRLRVPRHEWPVLVGSALLLWLGGNGLVTWAEQRAASAYAALLVGSTPIWVAIIEAILDRRAPTRLLVGALAVGFGGVAVLAVPTLREGTTADLWSLVALLGATLCWGLGSLVQSRHPIPLPPLANSAYQHLIGAAGFGIVILLLGEPLPSPTAEALWAWAYLVVFGSIVTFTAFIHALRLLPASIVFTYAYVNPVGAVLLGWLILHEEIASWTIGGAALVLLGVAGVFRDRQQRARRAAVPTGDV